MSRTHGLRGAHADVPLPDSLPPLAERPIMVIGSAGDNATVIVYSRPRFPEGIVMFEQLAQLPRRSTVSCSTAAAPPANGVRGSAARMAELPGGRRVIPEKVA
jgi:hypothetical protein